MNEDKFLHSYNKLRAFVYTPLGASLTYFAGNEYIDNGNPADALVTLIGLYFTIRGITGAINLYQNRKPSNLEKNVDE